MLLKYNFNQDNSKQINQPEMLYRSDTAFSSLGHILKNNEILQVIYTLFGFKPATRLTINEHQFCRLKKLLEKQGLHVLKSDFYVVPEMSHRGVNFASSGPIFRKGEKSRIFVYISTDKKTCAKLKQIEEKSDDWKFGKLLGYPICCLNHFIRNTYEKPGYYSMKSIGKYNKLKIYPYINNIALWVFGLEIINHFPCRPDCKESMDLGKQYLKICRRYDPIYSDFLETQLKSLVICSYNGSVSYSCNYFKKQNIISLNEINGDPKDVLFKKLKKNRSLIVCKNGFLLGNEHFTLDNARIAIYK